MAKCFCDLQFSGLLTKIFQKNFPVWLRLRRIRNKYRLARECAKLDPKLEQEMAKEGMEFELVEWPEYHVANHRHNFNK